MPTGEPASIDRMMNQRRRPWLALTLLLCLLLVGLGIGFGYYMLNKRVLPPSGGMYFMNRMALDVPLFLQGDSAWGQQPLGRSVRNMSQVGCAVTSASMIFKFYGIDTDPGRMNNFLRDHGGYTQDNDLIWEGPPTLAPTQVRHIYEDLPSYYLIDSNLRNQNPVIVRLRLSSGITHFVVIMGKQGFDYLIRDPSREGLRKGVYPLKELGSNIEALRFYQKIPTPI